jgi:hypothetical protein
VALKNVLCAGNRATSVAACADASCVRTTPVVNRPINVRMATSLLCVTFVLCTILMVRVLSCSTLKVKSAAGQALALFGEGIAARANETATHRERDPERTIRPSIVGGMAGARNCGTANRAIVRMPVSSIPPCAA